MKLWALVRHLPSILAIVGLVTLPLAAPVAASAAVPASTMAMADDMQRCPEKAPIPDCRDACPVATTCTTMCFGNSAALESAVSLRLVLVAAVVSHDDIRRGRMNEGPPPRPPKS